MKRSWGLHFWGPWPRGAPGGQDMVQERFHAYPPLSCSQCNCCFTAGYFVTICWVVRVGWSSVNSSIEVLSIKIYCSWMKRIECDIQGIFPPGIFPGNISESVVFLNFSVHCDSFYAFFGFTPPASILTDFH